MQSPENQAQFEALANALPTMISYVDEQERYVFVNDRYEQRFQRPKNAIQGKPVSEVLGEQTYKKIQPMIQLAMQGREQKFETALPGFGSSFVAEVSLVPDVGASNRVRGLFVLINDVTVRSRSESRFRALLESAPFCLQVYDENGLCRYANATWEKMWGVSRDVLKDYNILKDVHVAENGMLESIQRAFAGEAISLPPFFYDPAKNGFPGRPRFITAYFYPLKDDAGHILEVVQILEDVTDRLEAEEKLRHSRDQLDIILHGVTDGITVLNQEGRFIYANEAGAALCGFGSVAEFLSTPTAEVMGNFLISDENGDALDSRKLPGRLALQGVRSPPETIVRFRYKNSPADEKWSIINATPVFDANGKVLFAISIFRDFTERKLAERKLKTFSEQQAFLSEASKTLASSLNYETTLTAVAQMAVPKFADWCTVDILNEAGDLDRLAVAHKDPQKIKWAFELHKKYPPDPEASVAHAVLRTAQPVLIEQLPEEVVRSANLNSDYRKIILEIGLRSYIAVPLVARGKVLGVLTFILSAESGRNYTAEDLRSAEELGRRAGMAVDNSMLYGAAQRAIQNLERSNQDLERFAYVASHDLQEPLRMVANYTSLLARNYQDSLDEKANEYIGYAVAGAKRMHHLINDLLAFSRVRNQPVSVGPVDCNAVLHAALSNLKTSIENSHVSIHADPLPVVAGDASQLTQVFQNLIGNAIKFRSARDPEVRISARLEGEHWTVTVQDNGIGIESANLAKIFEVFKRLHPMDQYPGSGIGLSIVKKIIENHGGRIWVQSKSGEGSHFHFTLPLKT